MTSPKNMLKAWNIRAKKRLGQNFLSDPNMANKIIKLAKIQSNDAVIEIGAGLGALTIPLASAAQTVYAVEKDSQLLGLLKTELLVNSISNVVPIEQNILTLEFAEIAAEAGQKLIVMGNLPYNISSQVLIHLIARRHMISRAVLMFQKELAARLTASPGIKAYGRLTVMLRYCAFIKTLTAVESGLFFPKPRIDSEVIELTFHDQYRLPPEEESFFYRVIKTAFSKRRKTLKNALVGSTLSITASDALAALQNAGIDPQRRAETLNVKEFIALSRALSE
ncbi:MAG: ribosomal RNA small subunit methyltransferase A [Deltaproteobacteria bacterium]|nr:ribosomal RNA small subunit methyltransferase A [Deltaproteobacteria bacterium]